MILVVGVSGGSGSVYAVRLLEVFKQKSVETHLIVTRAAGETIVIETDYSVEYLQSLASKTYHINDIAAAPASGTFKTDGMIVIPCSMKTLAGISSGYADNLLLRSADVTLKEGRRLVLVPREMPLNIIHIENMLRAAKAGATIVPAMPAFYTRPTTIDDLVNQVVGKVLDLFSIEHELYTRWTGPDLVRKASRN